MAALRVFVSSTCVDLDAHRTQLRGLLTRIGYDPVMSDYSDVLYDHRLHTHTSCVKDIINADMVVLIIGSRFGGTALPEALSVVDLEGLQKTSSKVDALTDKSKLSITQVEVLRAIELDVPIFVLVDSKVLAAHHVYQKNKDKPFAGEITFPPIDKPETAKYIFEFINFITHRFSNNAITAYSSFADIEDHLLKQWSMMFQRLLREEREKTLEARRADIMIEQIQDLKAAVLQSISSVPAREVARSVLRYRRLADFLLAMRVYNPAIEMAEFTGNFDDLLLELGIVEVRSTSINGPMIPRVVLIRTDGTFIKVRIPDRRFQAFSVEWQDFCALEKDTRIAVLQAVETTDVSGPSLVTYVDEQYDEEANEMGVVRSSVTGLSDEAVTSTASVGFWNDDERVKQLISLWGEGLTASQIAERLGGISRNSVIAKAFRLGLKSRSIPSDTPDTDDATDSR